jgi:two-component system, response regulator YesN
VREALHVILDGDYSVLDVADGRTALDLIRAQRVDLLVLDILMPDVDGIEVLQELRSFEPHLPVIMMTGVKTVLTAVATMKLGAADYITKPFREATLLNAIRSALKARRALDVDSLDLRELGQTERRSHPHRLLLVEGSVGWRATLAVVLERVGRVQTASTLEEALNQLFALRPTCIVLNAQRAAEAARFLGAVHAQMPGSAVFVLSEDPHFQAALAWEALNIRAVMRSSAEPGAILDRIMATIAPLESASHSRPPFNEVVNRTIKHLSIHFGEDLSVSSLAKVVGVSGSYLAHLFRAETGLSVRNYLTKVRVEVASDLLAHTDNNLSEIADFVGFFDASHLSRIFRQIRGQRPSSYRASV